MIQAQNLAKYYGGKRALGPVNFEIERGECVGLTPAPVQREHQECSKVFAERILVDQR